MDTKAYIESGVIESCVLGLAGPEEMAELEMLCIQHPYIKKAVDDFAALIEKQAFNNAIPPAPELKGKLMERLAGEFTAGTENKIFDTPVISLEDNTGEVSVIKKPPFWKYVAAASVILLVASAALNFYLYNNYNSTNSKYQALLTERNSLQANNDVFRTKMDGLEESIRIMESPDMQKIVLPGVPGKDKNLAAVFWNSKTKDVYFLPTNMEAVPAGKQYQLWAIVDDVPVDAGLIDDCNGLCKMKNIPKAQAFAITLEKKGGSEKPTLSAMIVMGAI